MKTMRAVLPKATCLSAAQMRSIFSECSYAAFVATKGKNFAGFSLGFFHAFVDDPEIAALKDKNIFHLCLNIIEPKFQGGGIGLALLQTRINEAKRRGARNCTCFARSGASLHNLKKVGGKTIGIRKNYGESGETFHIVRINIA